MDGYEVVPESLFAMANEFGEARATWVELRKMVGSWTMESFDLGIIGELAGYPGGYNEVVTAVMDKLAEAAESFGTTDQALREVGKTYADLDASYYEQFGYLAESESA